MTIFGNGYFLGPKRRNKSYHLVVLIFSCRTLVYEVLNHMNRNWCEKVNGIYGVAGTLGYSLKRIYVHFAVMKW